MRVGSDADGVFYGFREVHSAFEVGRGNAHCALELAADHWDYFEGWEMNLDEWLTSYAEGVDAGVILWTGEPLPGAIETYQAIRDAGHSIHIGTDIFVGKEPEKARLHWLETTGFPYDTLTVTKDKTVLDVDIFLEDRLENADAVNASGTLCYLINRPWNQVPGGDDRPRIDRIEEYYDKVMEHAARLAA